MTTRSNNTIAGGISDIGSALQWQVPQATHAFPATIAASGSAQSALIASNGWQKIAAALTSSQAGVLSIQRYLDDAGTIPQGAPITANLTAATSAVVNAIDGAPFRTFTVKATNTGGSVANVTGIALLLQTN